MNKEKARVAIEQLVKRFDNQLADFKKGKYNETQTRNDFINPFFEALGWDITDKLGLGVDYRDVVHEAKIKHEGRTIAPDYCFTIHGVEKFYVEAKQPDVNIKDNTEPAFQLRRYGWSTKLPVSLLTDFEELAFYDCTFKPERNDKTHVGRLEYLNFKDYLTKFDFLWNTLSKDNVKNGSLENFIVTNKGKKSTTGVDAEFLKSLNGWRDTLARNIVTRNKNISEDELNYSMQKIIDRIIFLRICEDRGIENEKQLFNTIGTNTYNKLKDIFHAANTKYNSGLFDYKKDRTTDNLVIDDKTLKSIIEEMYEPISPYVFSVIPVEILGHSYEQYLGKVIKIDSKHKISIDEKPEVRKAGGVYYTPQYIVDYIVKNTVGKLVAGKTPEEVSKIKICDPACGSGSFLLGSYQYLLNWHREYYLKLNNKNIKSKRDTNYKFITPDGNLTTTIKKQILLNNIFGVDIDTNAVEVTKLSLMLKAMEGETRASINKQLTLNYERILPTLDDNIKSGNSLIDTDFYDNQIDYDRGAEKKIKPFNWKDNFPEVFNQGGFDVVIGNPPYVKEYTDREAFENIKKSHLKKYYQGKMDLWYFFVCYGIDLLKPNGMLGFIAPNNWVTNSGASILRKKIITDSKISEMIDFQSYMVFQDASIQTMIILLEKNKTIDNYKFKNIKVTDKNINSFEIQEILSNHNSTKSIILEPLLNRASKIDKFLLFESNTLEIILDKIKIRANFFLNEKEVANGIHPHYDFVNKSISKNHNNKYKVGEGIFGLTYEQLNSLSLNEKELELIKPYYNSSDQIKKYFVNPHNDLWIIYTGSEFKNINSMNKYPNLKNHLDKYRNVITSDNKPYGLHRARVEDFFKDEKIIALRKCSNNPIFAYADFPTYSSATFYLIKTERMNMKYLTGILNSKLVAFWLRYKGKMQGTNYQIDKEPLLQLPIFVPKNKSEIQNQLIKLVETMLHLNKDLQKATLPEQKEQVQARIKYTDKKIDKLVFELYELTEEEIKIVEGE